MPLAHRGVTSPPSANLCTSSMLAWINCRVESSEHGKEPKGGTASPKQPCVVEPHGSKYHILQRRVKANQVCFRARMMILLYNRNHTSNLGVFDVCARFDRCNELIS